MMNLESMQDYEILEILRTVNEEGLYVIHKHKLQRLLRNGKTHPGLWKALLDAWETLGCERSSLHVTDQYNDGWHFILTKFASKTVVGEARVRITPEASERLEKELAEQ